MAESAQIVTFLFTQDLRGDLRFLPKLARVLMQLRLVEQRTLTLDLGGMCSPEVWHCAVTDGRSMLIALDGLNYAAVNAEGVPDSVWPSLTKSLVYMQAVDSIHTGKMGHVRFVTRQPAEEIPPEILALVIAPHAEASIVGNTVYFPAVESHKVARMRVKTAAPAEIVSLEVFEVPPDTAPDPTISGMVEFIENEARQYGKRREQK
ncbi:MAG: hypothetical protein IPK52_24755 [Chloroflexi bacterium]|nr:hypothetical protein [Chloroflexota bacterium]